MEKAYFKYITALLLFGLNGIVASHISLSSYEIVLFRTLIGSLLLIAVVVLKREKLTFWRFKRQSVYIAVSGIAMGASWMFLYEAYQQIGVSIATLAYYCGPVIVMILSPVLFREKLTGSKVFGFMVVLCGIFLVNSEAIHEGRNGWGIFCGGMSAVMYAFMVIFNRKAKNITGLENAMLQLFISFIVVSVFIGFKQGFSVRVQDGDWLPILILGIVNTGAGCYLYFSSIDHLPVQIVAVCGYLEPLSAVIFSVMLLKEKILPAQICGTVLILGGAAFVSWNGIKPNKKTKEKRSKIYGDKRIIGECQGKNTIGPFYYKSGNNE